MAKKEKKVLEGLAKFNRVKLPTNILFSAIFIILAFCCVIPLIFVIIISFSSDESIVQNGYSFFPTEWSFKAYEMLWNSKDEILNATCVSLFVTVVGTLIGLFLNASMGYVLSRKQFKFRGLWTMIVFIPMIFGGGMVASYILMTQLIDIDNTLLVLILPGAVASYNIIIFRTFFTTTVPDSLIESGKIDGASQLRIFFQIVLPISLPAIATIGLFLTFGYWNDWWNAFMYIQDSALYPLQYVLVEIDKQMTFLTQSAQYMGMAAWELKEMLPEDGMRMALVVVVVLPIACSYPFFQRYFVGGLTVGAVKG